LQRILRGRVSPPFPSAPPLRGPPRALSPLGVEPRTSSSPSFDENYHLCGPPVQALDHSFADFALDEPVTYRFERPLPALRTPNLSSFSRSIRAYVEPVSTSSSSSSLKLLFLGLGTLTLATVRPHAFNGALTRLKSCLELTGASFKIAGDPAEHSIETMLSRKSRGC
jgi:hypothetical protein